MPRWVASVFQAAWGDLANEGPNLCDGIWPDHNTYYGVDQSGAEARATYGRDLGAAYSCKTVKFAVYTTNADPGATYAIEYSTNGTSWSTPAGWVADLLGTGWYNASHTDTGTISARYWRLSLRSDNSPGVSTVRCGDFRIYDGSGVELFDPWGGRADGKSTVTGTLAGMTRAARATVSCAATVSATLKIPKVLAGRATGAATVSGTLRLATSCYATAAGAATVSGTLRITRALRTLVQGAASVSAQMRSAISGRSDGSTTVSGRLAGTVPLQGRIEGVASVRGTLLVRPPQPTYLPPPDWEVRFYDGDGKRLPIPSDWVTAVDWTLLERGGFADANFEMLATWEELSLLGTERVDVWLYGLLVYRGWIKVAEQDIAEEGDAARPVAFGLMDGLNRILVNRRYCYGYPVDISTIAQDILADYVTVAGRYQNAEVEVADIGVTLQQYDAYGKTVAQALNGLCDAAPNQAIWGAGINASQQDKVYFKPRASTVAYVRSIGETCSAFVYPRDTGAIINALWITGGQVAQPNLLPNGSFEFPVPPNETVGNLLTDYSFETGSGWSLLNGAARQTSGHVYIQYATARTGTYVVELDTPGEEVRQTVSVDYTVPYVASCWARRESNGIAATVRIQVDGLDVNGNVVISTVTPYQDPGSSAWKRYTRAVDFTNWPAVKSLRVRYITDTGSEGATGTLLDDCGLWERDGVANSGWNWSLHGAATRLKLDWHSETPAAFHGGYCVAAQAANVSNRANDYLEISQSQSSYIQINPGQAHTAQLWANHDGGGAGFFRFGVRTYKQDGTLDATYVSSDMNPNLLVWTPLALPFTPSGTAVAAQFFVQFMGGATVYVDALLLVEGSQPGELYGDLAPGGYWQAQEYERVWKANDARLTDLSADAAASIATYGETDAAARNDTVVDYDTSAAFATSYFNAHAVPRVQAQMRALVADASEIIDFTGTVRLVNLEAPPPALFPSRLNYRVGGGDGGVRLQADLGNERPELALLLRVTNGRDASAVP